MGQIKNIKLHIVTDIKTLHTTNQTNNSRMRYVAAYLLAALGGNENPTTNDIKTILESVGVGYDEERASLVVNKCQGKSVAELIEAGSAKMASMPAGGGGGAAAASSGGDAAPAAVEEKKEEKKASSDESGSDDDMGFGLFD